MIASRAKSQIILLQLVLLCATLALWQVGARIGIIDPVWTSSPSLIAEAFWQSLTTGELAYHTRVTIWEALCGLLFGAAVGIGLGLLLGVTRTVGAIFEPFIVAMNSLPRVALAPLIVMYVGIGSASKFLLAFSLVVVPVMINTYEGISSVDPVLVNVMRVLGAKRRQTFLKLLLPNCVPWIFSALRVSISFAIIGAIVGEFISARAGIGYMISTAAGSFDTTGMLMPLFVLMMLAFLLDRLFLKLSAVLLRWRTTEVL
jgi:NitT/TauT family transport system permease protein